MVRGKKTSSPLTNRELLHHEWASEEAVTYLLRQVTGRLSRSLTESLKPHGQSANAYRVLLALARKNPRGISDLAESTLIDLSTLSRTVDRMRDDGLVVRGPGNGDGRSVEIAITAAGRRFLEEVLPIVSAQYQWSIRNVHDRELKSLQSTLKRMLADLKVSPIK